MYYQSKISSYPDNWIFIVAYNDVHKKYFFLKYGTVNYIFIIKKFFLSNSKLMVPYTNKNTTIHIQKTNDSLILSFFYNKGTIAIN